MTIIYSVDALRVLYSGDQAEQAGGPGSGGAGWKRHVVSGATATRSFVFSLAGSALAWRNRLGKLGPAFIDLIRLAV